MEKRTNFTAQEVRDLQFVFRTFDVNGQDILETEDVRRALRLLAFKVSRKTVQHLLQDLQTSGLDNKGQPYLHTPTDLNDI